MASSTENVKLGVCSVIFDGINLGYTKGGVEVEVTTNTHEVTVDQFGDTPIGEIITGRMVSATVPLAETTLENLVATMPGSTLISDGVKAAGTITFSTGAPVNTDSVTIEGLAFTFKTTPVLPTDIPIPATFLLAAAAMANAINSYAFGFSATVAAGVVTVTAKQRGTDKNVTMTKTAVTPANLTVVGLTGGTNPTKAKVVVNTGTGINLLTISKTLILRPKGTLGADDFTIFKAACPGSLNFTYNVEQERIYTAAFKGYAQADDGLFAVGDVTAV